MRSRGGSGRSGKRPSLQWPDTPSSVGVGGVGGAGKTEGQPHASPAELATDTLGQSRPARFRPPNAPDIHT